MENSNPSQEDKIIKVLLNEATREEVDSLEAWMQENPDHRDKFLALQNTWNTIEVERLVTAQTEAADWNEIATRSSIIESRPTAKLRSMVTTLAKMAAVLLIGTVGYFLPSFFSNPNSQEAFNVITAPSGSRTEILLPDQSKVWLNAGSKLRYPASFMKNQREVYLQGEAFFEVEHDQNRKFLVKTDDITIKVYGTSFNVKCYPGEPTIETTLVEGKISITKNSGDGTDKQKEIVLKPNQQAVWYSGESSAVSPGSIVVRSEINPGLYTSWREGELIIQSESLQDLAGKLERRYGVKIIFKNDEAKSFKFTGTIKNESIEQVLSVIKLASDIDFEISENIVTIKSKK